MQHFALHGTMQPFSCGGSEPIVITDVMIFLNKSKFRSYESQVFMLPKSARDCCAKVFVRQRMFHPLGKHKQWQPKSWEWLTRNLPVSRVNIWHLAKVDDYLNITSQLKRETLHFFDEASVIVTSSNCMFGSGYRGQRVIEVQRYASNASYTVNLMHSILCTWIDKLNTLPLSSSPMHFWRCIFSSWMGLTGIPVRTNLKFWFNNSPTSETMSSLISLSVLLR